MTLILDDDDEVPATPPQRRPRAQKPAPPATNGHIDEGYLIGCFLLDEGATLDRAIQAGLQSTDLHDRLPAQTYAALQRMRSRGIPIGLDTLVQEVGTTDLAQLMDWSDPIKLGTTARAGYYIDRILSERRRQQALTQARAKVQALERGEEVPEPANQNTKVKDILLSSIYRNETLAPKPIPVFTANGTTICTPGNITALNSQAKAGKTATIGAMLGATMEPPGAVNDTLGFKGANPTGKAVVHFDTEQSKYDWQQMIRTSLRRCRSDAPPPWLKSHLLTGRTYSECRQVLDAALTLYATEFGGIHAVLIDGAGDLVSDVNEAKECNEFVAHLHELAIRHDCAIILVLHFNPASDVKGRGHLGSQLERKCESNLTLEKGADGITRLYATKQRGQMITKDKAICFKWSDEEQMHISVNSSPEPKSGLGRPKVFTFERFIDIFPRDPTKALSRQALFKFAADKAPIKDTAFRDVLEQGIQTGLLVQTKLNTGYVYHLNLSGKA